MDKKSKPASESPDNVTDPQNPGKQLGSGSIAPPKRLERGSKKQSKTIPTTSASSVSSKLARKKQPEIAPQSARSENLERATSVDLEPASQYATESPNQAFPINPTATEPESLASMKPPSRIVISREDIGDGEGFVSMEATGRVSRRESLMPEFAEKVGSPSQYEEARTSSRTHSEKPSYSEGSGRVAPSLSESSIRFSLGGGIGEAPAQATKALLEAKEALESRQAGNLKREVRELAIEKLSLLHSLVFRLADSRSRAIAEAERAKANRHKDLEQLEKRHSKSLESALTSIRERDEKIDRLREELESVRGILNHDIYPALSEQSKQLHRMREERKSLACETSLHGAEDRSAELSTITDLIKGLSSGLGSCPAPGHITAADLVAEIKPMMADLMASGVLQGLNIKEEWEKVRGDLQFIADKNIQPQETASAELAATIRALEEQMKEHTKGVIELRERFQDAEETSRARHQSIQQLRRDLADTIETAAGAGTPIRTAVESLTTAVKEISLSKTTADTELGHKRAPVTQPSKAIKYGTGKTYASVVATPRRAMIVESSNPLMTGEEIITDIKTKIDVVDLGLSVTGLRKARNNKVIISLETEEDRSVMTRAIKTLENKYIVAEPNQRKPLLRISGVTKDLSDQRILEALIKQNTRLLQDVAKTEDFKIIRRTRSRNMETCNVILETSPKAWAALRDHKVRIGYQIVHVADQSPIRQCYRCLGFGHDAKRCSGEIACGYCAGHHDTRECDRSAGPRCTNCKEHNDHPAYSSGCPVWQKHDRLARTEISYC